MQISFAVTAKLISTFVFATRIVQFLYFLNIKFQASSHLLWLCSAVCVGPGRKPRRPVFSQRGSKYIPDSQSLAIMDEALTRLPCWSLKLQSAFSGFHSFIFSSLMRVSYLKKKKNSFFFMFSLPSNELVFILAHLSRMSIGELIVYVGVCLSVVCLSTISNDFSSEGVMPILFIFHI